MKQNFMNNNIQQQYRPMQHSSASKQEYAPNQNMVASPLSPASGQQPHQRLSTTTSQGSHYSAQNNLSQLKH